MELQKENKKKKVIESVFTGFLFGISILMLAIFTGMIFLVLKNYISWELVGLV